MHLTNSLKFNLKVYSQVKSKSVLGGKYNNEKIIIVSSNSYRLLCLVTLFVTKASDKSIYAEHIYTLLHTDADLIVLQGSKITYVTGIKFLYKSVHL